ncbi:ABC transporter ATP-binding protein, partial [bacterium]|nr:ABC transporter ATP-binding protein [bacterium]
MRTKNKDVNTAKLPKSLWKFYVMALWPWKWMLLLYGALVLGISFDRILQPLISKWVVTIFEGPVPAGYTFVSYAVTMLVLIAGLNLSISTCGLIRDWIQSHWMIKSRRHVSEILTDYVHHQSMSFWMNRMTGQVNSQMNYIANGYDAIRLLWVAIMRILTIFINGALLFQINYILAVAFLAILILRVVYAWIFRGALARAIKEESSVQSKLSGKLVDSLSNYSLVKLFARRRGEEKYLAPVRTEQVDVALKRKHLERTFWWVPGMMWDMCFSLILGLCVWLYMRGDMQLAEVMFTTNAYFMVMGTVANLIEMMPNIIEKLGSASKAYEELVVPIDIVDAADAKALTVTHGDIEFKNVSFKYRGKRAGVLDNFNLHIRPGERIGVVGASGAGKTTLVNLLMRFFD